MLKDVGQTSLAYLTAKTHGFTEESEKLEVELVAKNQSLPELDEKARLFVPPLPIQHLKENWPHLVVSTGALEAQLAQIKPGLHLNYFITFKLFYIICLTFKVRLKQENHVLVKLIIKRFQQMLLLLLLLMMKKYFLFCNKILVLTLI